MVARFLDRVITIDLTYQGTPKPLKRPLPETPIVCPECGQSDFTTRQALGGHRFHRHGVRD